jgi:hypothetical protein
MPISTLTLAASAPSVAAVAAAPWSGDGDWDCWSGATIEVFFFRLSPTLRGSLPAAAKRHERKSLESRAKAPGWKRKKTAAKSRPAEGASRAATNLKPLYEGLV